MQTIVLPRTENRRDLSRIVAFLSTLPITKPWRVRIDELKGDRTEYQNNALFGVAYVPLCAHIGCLPDELHIEMCKRFFGTRDVLGGQHPIRTTTRDEHGKRDVLNYERFSEFYAMVQQVGAEMNLWIPDPDRHLRSR